jgi:hypothetical protein
MRKVILLAASALLPPAMALADGEQSPGARTSGSVELSYDNNEYPDGFDYNQTGLSGTIFHDFGNGWGVQGAARFENVNYPGIDFDSTHLSVHGVYRTERWAASGFYAYTDLFGAADFNHYGLEGAFYLEDWTLTGSAINGDVGASYDRYRLGAKFFITENLSVGGGYAVSDYNDGGADWWSVDLGAEFRFATVPITLTAAYTRSDFDFTEVDGLRFGIRWDFGTASLRERDRSGASFEDARRYQDDFLRLD